MSYIFETLSALSHKLGMLGEGPYLYFFLQLNTLVTNLKCSQISLLGLELGTPPLLMPRLFETLSALPHELGILGEGPYLYFFLQLNTLVTNLQCSKLSTLGLEPGTPPLPMPRLFETLSALSKELVMLSEGP